MEYVRGMPNWIRTLPDHGPNPESRLFRAEGCACADLKDLEKLAMGWDVLGAGVTEYGYEELTARTPWLDLARCTRCGQHWYVATDTDDADLYMRRLTPEEARSIVENGVWPTYFDKLKHVGMDRLR